MLSTRRTSTALKMITVRVQTGSMSPATLLPQRAAAAVAAAAAAAAAATTTTAATTLTVVVHP